MKTKMLLLALAIMGTSLVYTQSPDQISKKDCDKKVLKKIKRKMNHINFKDCVAADSKTSVIVTCFTNEKNVIEVASIEGGNEKFNTAILEGLEKHPVKTENQAIGEKFSFMMTFKHISI